MARLTSNIKIVWAVAIADLLVVLFVLLTVYVEPSAPTGDRVTPSPMMHPPADWKGVQ